MAIQLTAIDFPCPAVTALDAVVPDGTAKEVTGRLAALGRLEGWEAPDASDLLVAYKAVAAALASPIDETPAVLVTECLKGKGLLLARPGEDEPDADLAVFDAVTAVLNGKALTVAEAPQQKKPGSQQGLATPKGSGPLFKVIGSADVGGQKVDVLALDAMSSQIRNAVAQVMKETAPDVYAKYRTTKDAGDGSLAARKAAYQVLFSAFLDSTYRLPGV